jgi:methyl-accepting chemotaxis protein
LFIALSAPESAILYALFPGKKHDGTHLCHHFIFWPSLLWMRRQSRELKTITRSMVKFSDYSENNLLIRQTDEIGELAKAFSKMASTIRNNVKELVSRDAVKANKSRKNSLKI